MSMGDPSQPGSYAHDWIQKLATDHQSSLEPSITSRWITEILLAMKLITTHWTTATGRNVRVAARAKKELHQSYSLLVLWADGYDVADGGLDPILSKSQTLSRSVIEVFSSITNILLKRLLPLHCPDGLELDKLRNIKQEAATSLYDGNGLDGSDTDSDTEGNESDSGFPAFSTSDFGDIVQDLYTDAQCLMDLAPLIKAAVPDAQKGLPQLPGKEAPTESSSLQQSWEPYLVFSDRISQRFPTASVDVVTRLAKANLGRLLRTKSQREMNRLARENPHLEEDTEAEARLGQPTQSEIGTKYHDSGIGTSVVTPSSYAETVMSYKQKEGEEGRSIKIPPLPEEAKKGAEFECVACGRMLRITSNSAWKRHLFLDLHPWMCIDLACPADEALFDNRQDWVQHLAWEHGFAPEWASRDCPLCGELIRQGKPSILAHIGSHLEEVSLASLPALPGSEEIPEEKSQGTQHQASSLSSTEAAPTASSVGEPSIQATSRASRPISGVSSDFEPNMQDMPQGGCRYITLTPEIRGQRCSCVRFSNDKRPGEDTCDCGHQASFHNKEQVESVTWRSFENSNTPWPFIGGSGESSTLKQQRRDIEVTEREKEALDEKIFINSSRQLPPKVETRPTEGKTTTKAEYERPKYPKVRCLQCNENPEGFRGDHELRRHIEARHRSAVKKWICRDPAEAGIPSTVTALKPLKDCKQCSQQKQYGAYYNAAAHLRRTHFKAKPSRRNASSTIPLNEQDHTSTPSHYADWPPMSELKKWMVEITVVLGEEKVDDEEIEALGEDFNFDDAITYRQGYDSKDAYGYDPFRFDTTEPI